MKFNVTVDKKAEAAIDRRLCINCGECREICPTGAVRELQKTAVCMKAGGAAGYFPEAEKKSVEMACSGGCPLGIVPQTVASFVESWRVRLSIYGRRTLCREFAQLYANIFVRMCASELCSAMHLST